MRTDHRIFLVFGFFALFSGMATAQLSALSINPVQTELQSVTILGYQSQTYVNGAPYSAIEESLCSQRLPGNRIRFPMSGIGSYPRNAESGH